MGEAESSKPRVLVVDDGTAYAEVIAAKMPEVSLINPEPLGREGRLADGPSALEFLRGHRDEVDVVLLDMHFDLPEKQLLSLPEATGIRKTRRFQGVAILREIRKQHPALPVVLLSSYRDLAPVDAADELAAQSMTYLFDSDDLDSLRIRINAAWKQSGQSGLDAEESDVLWGSGAAMRSLKQHLSVLARGRVPVILEGETGTGKSFLAESFVHARSGRPGPFVVCDLAAQPAMLIPAYLFGAVRGAYTGSVTDRKGLFELAHRGTLFFDEVQNIPLDVQKQLLQVLQDRRVRPLGSAKEIAVDVKVVAASNQPLDRAVAAGHFRSDLYMRLSPATRVRIPSLAERKGDLEFLMRKFVEQALRDSDIAELKSEVTRAIGLSRDIPVEFVIGRSPQKERDGGLTFLLPRPAWQMLVDHPWPGNVRELQNVATNLVIFTLIAAVDAVQSGVPLSSSRLQIDPGLVGELLSGSATLVGPEDNRRKGERRRGMPFSVTVEPQESLNAVASSVERQYLLAMFQETKGNFSEMAGRLLNNPQKGRAVRLRFNQLGLKVRDVAKT